jgi:hypothetical protein
MLALGYPGNHPGHHILDLISRLRGPQFRGEQTREDAICAGLAVEDLLTAGCG